jgi:hypothetical protein
MPRTDGISYSGLGGNSKMKREIGDLGVDGRVILKRMGVRL